MNRTIRPVRLALLPVLSVALLAGCGAGPVRTGSAAVVGDTRITTTTLEDVVARGLQDPQAQQQLGADRAGYQRQVLSRLITGDLLRAAAATPDVGVSVTAGEVDARLAQLARQLGGQEQLQAQAAQSGIALPDLRPFISDLVLNDKIGDALVKDQQVPTAQLQALYQKDIAQYDQVVARHILLKTKAEADQVLAQVKADPSQFATIAAARSLDEGSKARGGQLDPAGRGAYVKPFEDALFAAKPGDYGVVQSEFGFHVWNLLARNTVSFAQAEPELRRQVLQPQREAALGALLRKTAAGEHIRVNPRFGRWDPSTGSVVADAAEGPGVVSSPDAGSGGGGAVAPGEPAPDDQPPVVAPSPSAG